MKKWLCEFNVDRPLEVKKTEKGKDDNGQEVDITRTLNKKEAIAFKLQKPTRKMFEEGELYYAVKLSEGIKAGLLTTAQVAKRYENDGGVYTEYEKKRLRELRKDIAELQGEYFKLQDDEEASARKIQILTDINNFRTEISDIENVHQYIYDQTAEVKARNKTILWWILQLAHKTNDSGSFDVLFNGNDIDEKLDNYDEMEDSSDDFTSEFLKKLAYYVSYWYVSKNVGQEDFATVEALYQQSSDYIVVEDPDPEEQPKAEEAEEPKAEEPKAEEPKAEEPKAEEPKAEEPKVEEPKVEEAKTEESK